MRVPTPVPATLRWLLALSWPALKHQWGRQLLALLAITLGVALPWGVYLINASALSEFGAASRALAGQADLVVTAQPDGVPDALFGRLAQRGEVALASAVVETAVQIQRPHMGTEDGAALGMADRAGPVSLRMIGLDPLVAASFNPELLPIPQAASSPAGNNPLLQMLASGRIFLSDSARKRLGLSAEAQGPLTLRFALGERKQDAVLNLAGRIHAGGAPLAVMDIAAAQTLFGKLGHVDRVDLRLRPGIDAGEFVARLRAEGLLPPTVRAAPPADEASRIDQMTRAYRVNLGVLSLMALFTGSFLVFAVVSLSVAQRLPEWALLGVLGMSAAERARLVLAEAMVLGVLGSTLGLGLGIGLAALTLKLLGGDLGSGMLAGSTPSLRLDATMALLFGLLGVAVSMASAALPALAVRRMAVAQVLKGFGDAAHWQAPVWLGAALLLAGGALTLLPPLWGLSLGAYAAMLCLLLGGLACLPPLLRLMLRAWPTAWTARHALGLLLRQRGIDRAGEFTQMVAGTLVALALSVSMLVMVNSFRASLIDWLQQMLPADLYVRASLRELDGRPAPLPAAFIAAVRASGLASRLGAQRVLSIRVPLSAAEPGGPVLLLAREVGDGSALPLASELHEPPAPGLLPVYVNEALRDERQLQLGQRLTLDLREGLGAQARPVQVYVRAVWRDYSRQSGALLLPHADYLRLSGDSAVTDLFIWLPSGADLAAAQAQLRGLAAQPQDIELAAAGELLAFSMRLFERSFAVTYWLQAVALGIGLFGVAASQSAQMLARRREFGLLLHLGFTRGQVLRLLMLEAALCSAAGVIAGLLLGLAISAVLVWVVNPQSFHWSMDLTVPWDRLAALAATVFAAGALAAWLSGRLAARADMVQAVKEDW